MLQLTECIDVTASPQAVWAVLSDPHAVVECVEGASLGAQHEDGSYDAGLLVSFGPARVTFRARFSLELDPATLSGTLSARGKDNQGGTRIKVAMKFRVLPQEEGSGTTVFIDADVDVGGRLASLVRSGASRVVQRMNADFARCLGERLAGSPG